MFIVFIFVRQAQSDTSAVFRETFQKQTRILARPALPRSPRQLRDATPHATMNNDSFFARQLSFNVRFSELWDFIILERFQN